MKTAKVMNAVIIETYGGPEVLQYKEVQVPTIQSDEILVRVYSAGVSPFDLHVRDGWFKDGGYSFPIILGCELSGVIAAVGEDVSKYKEGDPVFAHPNVYRNCGAYATYAAVKQNELALKPDSISHHEAAAASMNALTAWQALFDIAHLTEGQKILIHAAAGGVGHLAVQLAKWKGAYVIGTASAKNKEFLIDLGIDEVIDYTAQPFEKMVKDVDVVLDAIGNDVLMKSFLITKKDGIVVSMIDFDKIKKASEFGVRGENVIVTPKADQLKQIAKLLGEGKMKVHVNKVFPLRDAAKAQALLQSGHTRGKIVLEV